MEKVIIMARIPIAPVGRIIKESGAERVSEDAKVALEAYLEEKAEEVSRESIKLAALAKRKTVKAEDIELAVKNL